MPNYRNKNKHKKNKNRNKQNQQQQQQSKSQQQSEESNQAQNRSQPPETPNPKEQHPSQQPAQAQTQSQQTNQSRKRAKKQTAQVQAQAVTTAAETATTHNEAPEQQPLATPAPDAKASIATAPDVNFGEEELVVAPTITSNSERNTAVEREECNVAVANNGNTVIANISSQGSNNRDTPITLQQGESSEMGNKNSHILQPISQRSTDAANVVDSKPKSDADGVVRPDRTIAGARELITLPNSAVTAAANDQITPTEATTTANPTQMAKVIVHRIIQDELPLREQDEHNVKQEEQQTQVALHGTQKSAIAADPEIHTEIQDGVKVIIHRIALEGEEVASQKVRQQPTHVKLTQLSGEADYRVEQPDSSDELSMSPRSTWPALLGRKDVQIQEISDESASEYNENPPVISEAESETELSLQEACASIVRDHSALSIHTLSPTESGEESDCFEVLHNMTPVTVAVTSSTSNAASPLSPEGDLKQRRAQKRVALETHFLPQLLSPRYLDSITEENSDMSDARSDCSDNPLMSMLSGDDFSGAHTSKTTADTPSSPVKATKANAIFPRSHLDFTKRHKKNGPLPKNANLPHPVAIREESPGAMMVETRLVETPTAEECCTRLASEHTPESEAAEVVYIDSASSSLSDLMELAETDDGGSAATIDEVMAWASSTCRGAVIDLDTDACEIIARPPCSDHGSRETTPVNQTSNGTAAAPTTEEVATAVAQNAAQKSSQKVAKSQAQIQAETITNIEQQQQDQQRTRTRTDQLELELVNNGSNKTAKERSAIDTNMANMANMANADHADHAADDDLRIVEQNNKSDEQQQQVANAFVNLYNSQLLAATSTALPKSTNERVSLPLSNRLSSGSSASGALTTNTSTTTTIRTTTIETSATTKTAQRVDLDDLQNTNDDADSSSSRGSGSESNSGEAKYSTATTSTSSDSSRAEHIAVDPQVLLENIEIQMNSVREILNSHIVTPVSDATTLNPILKPIPRQTQTAVRSDTKSFAPPSATSDITSASASALKQSPSPPPIPPPPTSATTADFNSAFTDFTDFARTLPPSDENTSKITTTKTIIHNIYTPENFQPTNIATSSSSATYSQTPSTSCYPSTSRSPSNANSSVLSRQASADSHCSDSTNHSQCTAINVGTRAHNDFELTHASSSISDDGIGTDLHTLTPIDPNSQNGDAAIKKLRLLCTETLASMPYGEQVLEELATVAQNIGELQTHSSAGNSVNNSDQQPKSKQQQPATDAKMPYPLPDLPHIGELQLSLPQPPKSDDTAATHTVAIRQLAAQGAQKTHSPSPPPVPAPPTHYDTWLGMPTSADPQLLVCLSPAQRACMDKQQQQQQQQQPDQLLDAHQKFLERRGYHEFSEEQVKALNAERLKEQQILETAAIMKRLRKSLTPPPPLPPPPVPSKSSETAAKAQNQAKTQQQQNDASAYRNANEQQPHTNGEEQLTLTQTQTLSQAQQKTSSHENNSRQTMTTTPAPTQASFLLSMSGAHGEPLEKNTSVGNTSGSQQPPQRQPLPQTAAHRAEQTATFDPAQPATQQNQQAANTERDCFSHYATHSFPTASTPKSTSAGATVNNSSATSTMQGVESELAKMFPTMGNTNIFDNGRKRFSNIESSTTSSSLLSSSNNNNSPYCAQLMSTQPKRYSNIETRSYEAQKHLENGKVIYDYLNSSQESKSEGDKSLAPTAEQKQFPMKEPKEVLHYPFSSGSSNAMTKTTTEYSSGSNKVGSHEIMSASKLNTTTPATANMTNNVGSGSASAGAGAVPPSTSMRSQTMEQQQQQFKNSDANVGAYEEFRQRAKVSAASNPTPYSTLPATAPPTLGTDQPDKSAFHFSENEKLFKDFDELSQQLHRELETGKAQREQREKSASLFDLSRPQWHFKDHFEQLKKERHEHMQELEREIERSMHSRRLRSGSNPSNLFEGRAQTATQTGARTYDIPIQMERETSMSAPATPMNVPQENTGRTYNIPIQLESNGRPAASANEYDSHNASRYRRAESMFNLSDSAPRAQANAHSNYLRPQPQSGADDWSRYASDLGSSENITRPFAREVEICYQRQRPRTIRAPRLSVSTSDLSHNTTQSYDNYNAYNVRRTHAPMLQPQLPQRTQPHHASCYSVLQRDPNPTYISTTSRRGVSPAPPTQTTAPEPHYEPHVPERQRRASLPREVHEQQLKYISSKEEELKTEFERLQNERRRLMDEIQRAPTLQMPQHPMRDMYRPAPKLPTLSEDEVFRQQMAEEWLNKVAEREERRLQKIIKISKITGEQLQQQHGGLNNVGSPGTGKPDISEEFLKRVKERRSKLAMPADSDWESGAESQPVAAGHASESDDMPPIKVLEGKIETDLRQLPRHLREFARYSDRSEEQLNGGGQRVVQQEEERRHEANDNSMSSAFKKSSVVKTVKIARPEQQPPLQHRVPAAPIANGAPDVGRRTGKASSLSGSSKKRTETTANARQDVVADHVSSSYGRQSQNNTNELPPMAPQTRYPTKKTRFLLEPNRRSWSESDLLREIDRELKLAKGFLFANEEAPSMSGMFAPKFKATAPTGSGIWTPGTQTPATSFSNLHEAVHTNGEQFSRVSCTPPPPPVPGHPVWTPQPSPSSGRKEFRPVRFESPTLPRRYVVPQNSAHSGPVAPPWCNAGSSNNNHSRYNNNNGHNYGEDSQSSYAAPSPRSTRSYTTLSTPTTITSTIGDTINYRDSFHSESSLNTAIGAADTTEVVAPSSSVADKIKTFERSASTSALYPAVKRRQYSDSGQRFCKPNEVLFKVKHEYMSEPETDNDHPRKMAQLGRRQFDGIGPVTNDGMPIILRSEVKEPHQHEWYKRLYQTIHKQKSGDDYVIRYKCQRARPQYKSTGYQSEPEPNYDSDYSTVKYRTLDRRRIEPISSVTNVANRHTNNYQDDKSYGTMPNPIKSEQQPYKNQPGRIENYITGRSSVSEKERKEWWDEVMDIFNGHLDQTKLSPHYTEGNLSRALAKDSGYTSDSNLVFRKRDIPLPSPLSPVEQKQAYKSVQAGGEPPLFGFRKPAPERPKAKIEYTQITPTLCRIRVVPQKQPPATTKPSIHKTIPNAATLSKTQTQTPSMYTSSFISMSGSGQRKLAPPQPPNRRSSCQKAATRTSPARPPKPAPVIPKRHEQCFQSPDDPINKYATITLRKHTRTPICRSKSAGTVCTSLLSTAKPASTQRSTIHAADSVKLRRAQQHTRFRSISPAARPTQCHLMSLRPSSRSPVAFGRSISKERTFAEEKKRLESSLPTGYTNFEASTNILRDPYLKSPQEVKQAVRSYATCGAYLRSKSLPRLTAQKPIASSSVSTTVRHSTCFPQAKILDCTKAVRKSLLSRSKSPASKAISTMSLTRTDSTFSVDSNTVTITKEKPKSAPTKKAPTTVRHHTPAKSLTSTSLSKRIEPVKPAKSTSNTKLVKPKAINGKSPADSSHYLHETVYGLPENTCQYQSLHKSRSLSPRRYYQIEDCHRALHANVNGDQTDHDSLDELVWQYEHGKAQKKPQSLQNTVRDIARPESPTPSLKDRKFSPTREIRVPTQPQSLQIAYQRSRSPKGVSSDTEELAEHKRKFSPTREIRVPPPPPPLPPSQICATLSRTRSPKTVRDIARPESPTPSDGRRTRYSPTREVRLPQLPQCVRPTHSAPQPIHTSRSVRDIARPESPSPGASTRKFSPTREVRVPQSPRNLRSPSRRRIDTYRAQAKGETSKVIRASSLSSADDRSQRGLYLCGELAHSATSLSYHDRHSPTCPYRNNSERFTDLNRFYSTLERVGQLERATSLTSFKPIRRDGEVLDFDEWRKIRCHERAEKELHFLVGKLKHDQRTKDFVFRSKDVEDVKWHHETDFGLHSKEKSVEDLRYAFEQKNMFADYEQQMRQDYEMARDHVRPYWRRNTVADLASNLEGRIQSEADEEAKNAEAQAKFQLSNRLVSTLSKEQVKKITDQLNDIYSNNARVSSEDYVVTVDHHSKPHTAASNTLKVRCNSSITKEELLAPHLYKKEAQAKAASAAANREHRKKLDNAKQNTLTVEKPKGTRSNSPIMLARETRGAVAAKNAEATLTKSPHMPASDGITPNPDKNMGKPTSAQVEATATVSTLPTAMQSSTHIRYEQCDKDIEPSLPTGAKAPKEKISQKIQYFEERQYDEPPKTIYHAREDSSPDEAEVMRIIEEKMKSRARKQSPTLHREMSNSLTDLKDLFGERNTARVNFHMHSPPARPPDVNNEDATPTPNPTGHDCIEVSQAWYDLGDLSPHSSVELLDAHYRSRSLSPASQCSSYLQRVHTGDVQKMRARFESFGAHDDSRCDFFGVSSLRKARSDSELKQFDDESKDALHTPAHGGNNDVAAETRGDVSWITHQFEQQRSQSLRRDKAQRGRPRGRVISPISVKDRMMPHIDIISKTAALKETKEQPKPKQAKRSYVVERIRSQYERDSSPESAVKHKHISTTYIGGSHPDITSTQLVSPHLSANWIAHKYPSPKQNTCKGSEINFEQPCRRSTVKKRLTTRRASSASPPRPLKPTQDQQRVCKPRFGDIFANQEFDPKKHQPKARYVPDGAEATTMTSSRKRANTHPHCSGSCDVLKSSMAVSFKDDDNNPPIPPKPSDYKSSGPNLPKSGLSRRVVWQQSVLPFEPSHAVLLHMQSQSNAGPRNITQPLYTSGRHYYAPPQQQQNGYTNSPSAVHAVNGNLPLKSQRFCDYEYAPRYRSTLQPGVAGRLHQSCHDLRTAGNVNEIGLGLPREHRWARTPKEDDADPPCNIANCGKVLWISRDPETSAYHNNNNSFNVNSKNNKGYYYDREQNVRIRTNAKGLPYTPLPERKQDYLANQRAIEAMVPLVMNKRRFNKSPNRYLESDVNIHFRTPVRHEFKQPMSDEELAIRQAEHMQKLYQEERRRKYFQELQDMNARRHTDNFTPTQKSPIPLNRYDDFPADLALKSPNAGISRMPSRALYNFQGQNARELTFKKGDIIYIRRQIDRNWYEGEHNAMIGLLPVSYVEVINKDSTARVQPKKPSEGQARAKYNFQAQSGIELSLNKGELVTLTRRVDDNWFEGKVANRKGIFPVSYVEVLTDIGAEDVAARTIVSDKSITNLRPSLDALRTNINNEFNLLTKNGHQPPNGILKDTKHLTNNKIDALHVDTHSDPLVYRALYKYRPQNSDEMELLEGDIVHVLEICDDGWFVGTSQRTGCFGTFPGNYVERAL